MGCHSELESFEPDSQADSAAACWELRIFRSDGALSIIYLAVFGSDEMAISEAEKIARRGYRIDVWRDETRIGRISDFGGLDKGSDIHGSKRLRRVGVQDDDFGANQERKAR